MSAESLYLLECDRSGFKSCFSFVCSKTNLFGRVFLLVLALLDWVPRLLSEHSWLFCFIRTEIFCSLTRSYLFVVLCIAFFALFSIGFLEFHRLGFCCNFRRTFLASLEFFVAASLHYLSRLIGWVFGLLLLLLILLRVSFISFGSIVEVCAWNSVPFWFGFW